MKTYLLHSLRGRDMGSFIDDERQKRDRLVAELMDNGKSKEEIMAELNISNQAYCASLHRMNRLVYDYEVSEATQKEIESKLRVTEKVPKVKKFTDRKGKTWDDVSEFWGL